jgi:hypothetical protein
MKCEKLCLLFYDVSPLVPAEIRWEGTERFKLQRNQSRALGLTVDNLHRLGAPCQSQCRVATNQKQRFFSAAIIYVVRGYQALLSEH